MSKPKPPKDPMAFMFPDKRAREAADLAVDRALVTEPYIPLVKACAVWNDAYQVASGGKHPGARP